MLPLYVAVQIHSALAASEVLPWLLRAAAGRSDRRPVKARGRAGSGPHIFVVATAGLILALIYDVATMSILGRVRIFASQTLMILLTNPDPGSAQ
jgi:hypothetical protein